MSFLQNPQSGKRVHVHFVKHPESEEWMYGQFCKAIREAEEDVCATCKTHL